MVFLSCKRKDSINFADNDKIVPVWEKASWKALKWEWVWYVQERTKWAVYLDKSKQEGVM